MTTAAWKPNAWVSPCQDEPVHGIMLRLAEANGIPSLKDLETMAGVTASQVRRGEKLTILASMLRCDVSDIEDRCYRHVSGMMRSFRGVSLGVINDLETKIRRCCPDCLALDHHHRFWWDLVPISTCPFHGRKLVSTCSCGTGLSWRDGTLSKCVVCDDGSVHHAVRQAVSADVIAFDRVLLAKVGVGTADAGPVFDALDFRAAVEVAGRVGALDSLGYGMRWAQPEDCLDPPEVVRARGWRILRDERLGDVLDRVYDEFRQATTDEGGRQPRIDSAYGWFMHWFRYQGGENYSAHLARLIVENAEGKFRLTSDTLPNTPRSGASMNLTQAARACGISARSMRRLLSKEGLIRPETVKGSPVRVERVVVDRIADDLATSLSQVDLLTFTGLRITAIEQLTRTDVIPGWLKGGGVDARRYLYRRTDVLAWMQSVLATARVVESVPSDAIPLSDLSARIGFSIVDILRMLDEGGHDVFVAADTEATFETVHVDASIVSSPSWSDAVSLRTVRRHLGVSKSDVEKLVEAGSLVPYVGPIGNRSRKGSWYRRSSLDELTRKVEEAATAFDRESSAECQMRLTKAVTRLAASDLSWADVLSAIARGRLRACIDRSSAVSLIAALYVESADSVAIALNRKERDAIPSDRRLDIYEAATLLGTRPQVICILRRGGLLGSPSVGLGLTAASICAFREKFILVPEIIRKGGFTYFEITKKLEQDGIEPSLMLEGYSAREKTRVYDRLRVETFLQQQLAKTD